MNKGSGLAYELSKATRCCLNKDNHVPMHPRDQERMKSLQEIRVPSCAFRSGKEESQMSIWSVSHLLFMKVNCGNHHVQVVIASRPKTNITGDPNKSNHVWGWIIAHAIRREHESSIVSFRGGDRRQRDSCVGESSWQRRCGTRRKLVVRRL